jgi:nitric oxide reductase subunit B
MQHSQTGPTNHLAWFFLVSSAVGHFFGAGVWGFAQTLPQVNQWTHGTLLTASHGHFAFFGAFGLLVLSAIYYMTPNIKGIEALETNRGVWSYRLMIVGMLFIVLSFTMAGTVQTYLHRMIGLDFMVVRDQYLRFWMFWVWFFGLVLFLPGVFMYLLDITNLRPSDRKDWLQINKRSVA